MLRPIGSANLSSRAEWSGKEQLLDALQLVTESMNTSLEHALRERGGINEVRRRSSGHPTHFGIRFDWQLPNGTGKKETLEFRQVVETSKDP